MITTTLAFLVTIIFSALHSAWEMGIATVQKGEVKNAEGNGIFGAGALLKVIKDKEKFLATNTICNNIANIMGSGMVGQFAGAWLGSEWVGVVMALLTLTIIVCSEIIPKAYGANNPLLVGRLFAPMMILLARILNPINQIIGVVTARFKGAEPSIVVEKIQEGTYNLGIETIQEVGTPRVNLTYLWGQDKLESIKKDLFNSQHSRVVVLGKTLDDVIGVVLLCDTFKALAQDKNPRVKDLMRPVLKMPSETSCLEAFQTFASSKSHLAVMIDEFGGNDGVVTLEDIQELIAQTEFQDETDKQECMRRDSK